MIGLIWYFGLGWLHGFWTVIGVYLVLVFTDPALARQARETEAELKLRTKRLFNVAKHSRSKMSLRSLRTRALLFS